MRTFLAAALSGALMITTTGCTPLQVLEISTVIAKEKTGEKPVLDHHTDPNALFWEMFRRQAQQPIVRSRTTLDLPDIDAQDFVHVTDTTIDYTTKTRVSTDTSHGGEKYGTEISEICDAAGTHHRWSPLNDAWDPPEPGYPKCFPYRVAMTAGDGIIPGGLPPEKIDLMVTALTTRYDGFLTANKATKIEKNGQHYIEIQMKATPVVFDSYGDDLGWSFQNLIWAFQETGLDYDAHPYGQGDGSGEHANMIYWIDPTTLLPAYHCRRNYYGTEYRGTRRVEYVRPAGLPEAALPGRDPRAAEPSAMIGEGPTCADPM
ncbi:hypothetical protein MOQ72_36260 [Saccharopolyspora sp. K220]|uniref:hypothetical protein n=1 Tax=Saccharopolyspora soli TaxID=2926618 RepID=UPI001F57D154|nr:hypothetical protein [Saccharopolyspora soli]MCI2422893.1 hypothetical protein [Saccharopolyspora soli]